MNPHTRRQRRQRRKDRRDPWRNDPLGPPVCPGCYAVGPDPCAPGCVDAEMAAERERYEADEDDDVYDEIDYELTRPEP